MYPFMSRAGGGCVTADEPAPESDRSLLYGQRERLLDILASQRIVGSTQKTVNCRRGVAPSM